MYYGSLTMFSADNLASNAVGGFKESSSALRHCRQCLGTNDGMRSQVHTCICLTINFVDVSCLMYFRSRFPLSLSCNAFTLTNTLFPQFEEYSFHLRTKEEHLQHCNIIENADV